MVDLTEERVGALVAALGPDFDVDGVALARAARDRTSWNVIHQPTVTKIDLFVLREAAFDRSEFARRLPGQRGRVRVALYGDGFPVSARCGAAVPTTRLRSRGAAGSPNRR